MEAKLILQFKTSLVKNQIHYKNNYRRQRTMMHAPRTIAVMLEPVNNQDLSSSSSSSSSSKNVYNDNWFDRAAINYLSTSVQATTGFKSTSSGYDGLVEAARAAHRVFDPAEQQQIVLQALETAFPSFILGFIRAVLPKSSKFTREYFASFTTVFFAWLVGPCEVRESEFEGRREKNVVYIKKCRFLEESNCVGMCTNLCKGPSQVFVKKSFGMPFYMVPNFEDMSCEMIYGQEPPQPTDDPAFSQPCYKLCKESKRHHQKCAT
ncbi:hypothetical protein Leryth_005494 [Lithospermum erythrorhizon]|uniref:Isomerase n=1 Tax=Lithospermum erythrorhizon TaxID=34254 RepID=A0AAV3P2F3_LITER|nr:hypothetical protein Leryth_005494 [Lithospermum erythrorhizon]